MLGLYCASFAYAGKGSSAAERSSRLTSEHFATDTMCFVQFQLESTPDAQPYYEASGTAHATLGMRN